MINKLGNKIKTKIKNEKEYKIFQNKKIIGIILSVLFVFLFVVSLVDIPIFTTIHAYTFGFLFGYYCYFVYIAMIFQGLILSFDLDVLITRFFVKKINKTLFFNWITYCIFVFGIALIIESSIAFSNNEKVFNGINSFESYYRNWWESFRSSEDPVLPNTLNGGVVLIFFVALFSSIAGNIMTIIIGILLLLFFIYYMLFGSPFKMIKKNNKQHKLRKMEEQEYETKILDLSYESKTIDNKNKEEISETEIIEPNQIFETNDINDNHYLQEEFIRKKTEEISKHQSNQKIIDNIEIEEVDNNNFEEHEQDTFEFELDIFNTTTSVINTDKIIDEPIRKNNKEK